METIWDGVVIGGAGGAIAGITVYLVQYVHEKIRECSDKRIIYNWLLNTTTDKSGEQFRSTRAIASWCNLPQERVREICSLHKKIFLSTGEKEDMWGIFTRREDSVYDDRGFIHI